jgi:DNA-binding transcriptional regulator YiaG
VAYHSRKATRFLQPSIGIAKAAMTGSELRRIRNSLDLSRVEFGRALGYRGENVSRMVRRLEDGERKITEEIAEIATKLSTD